MDTAAYALFATVCLADPADACLDDFRSSPVYETAQICATETNDVIVRFLYRYYHKPFILTPHRQCEPAPDAPEDDD